MNLVYRARPILSLAESWGRGIGFPRAIYWRFSDVLTETAPININSFSIILVTAKSSDAWCTCAWERGYIVPLLTSCYMLLTHCYLMLHKVNNLCNDLLFSWLLTGVQVDTGAPTRPSSWPRRSRLKPTPLLCGSSTVTGGRSCILRYKHTHRSFPMGTRPPDQGWSLCTTLGQC